MKDELQDYMGRPKRYDNVDGTGEILMGLMCLGFGLLSYLQTILPRDSIWRTNGLASLLFMYAVLALVLGPGYALRKIIKKHLTWPRTGYVALGVGAHPDAKAKRSYWALLIAIAVLSGLIAAGVVGVMDFERKHAGEMPSLAAVGYVAYLAFWVLGYAFWVWRMGREHTWKWLVLVLLALGLLLIGLFGPGNFIEVARPVMFFVGLTWVISGVITLCLYLRHTRSPGPQAQ